MQKGILYKNEEWNKTERNGTKSNFEIMLIMLKYPGDVPGVFHVVSNNVVVGTNRIGNFRIEGAGLYNGLIFKISSLFLHS